MNHPTPTNYLILSPNQKTLDFIVFSIGPSIVILKNYKPVSLLQLPSPKSEYSPPMPQTLNPYRIPFDSLLLEDITRNESQYCNMVVSMAFQQTPKPLNPNS